MIYAYLLIRFEPHRLVVGERVGRGARQRRVHLERRDERDLEPLLHGRGEQRLYMLDGVDTAARRRSSRGKLEESRRALGRQYQDVCSQDEIASGPCRLSSLESSHSHQWLPVRTYSFA